MDSADAIASQMAMSVAARTLGRRLLVPSLLQLRCAGPGSLHALLALPPSSSRGKRTKAWEMAGSGDLQRLGADIVQAGANPPPPRRRHRHCTAVLLVGFCKCTIEAGAPPPLQAYPRPRVPPPPVRGRGAAAGG